MAQNDHAIIVGIDKYPGLSSLGGPCKDAFAFRNWLVASDCGNVPTGNVRILLTTNFHPPGPTSVHDAHPLEEEISSLFQPFITKGINKEIAGRRLYIYMAGHGFGDPNDIDTAALYAANAESTYASHVAGTVYAEWFKRNGVFDEIVLIMDCCRTVNPIWSIRPPLLPNTSNPGRVPKIRTVYAYATSWGQASRERKMNGDIRGIFTVALINALNNAKPNQYGRVTGQLIKDYVHNTFKDVADEVEVEDPEIKVDSKKDITFIEREAVKSYRASISLSPFTGNEKLIIIDSRKNEVFTKSPDGRTVNVDLTSDFYKALIEGTDRNHLFEIGGSDVEFTL